jgi:membrane protein involved in colicin uptake
VNGNGEIQGTGNRNGKDREQATTTATATAKAKASAKYRDLSTAAAKCAAFGRDDICFSWVLGKQATARTGNGKDKNIQEQTTARTRTSNGNYVSGGDW